MQDVLNSLLAAHEQLKAQAHQLLDSEGGLAQEVLDSLNGLKAYIAAFRQAHGL